VLRELFETVAISINWLFNLSMILRDPSPVDRYSRAAEHGDYDTAPDIEYIRMKLPHLSQSGNEWLVERLGKANALRRQFFNYCRAHQTKLASADATESNCSSTVASAYVENAYADLETQSPTEFDLQSNTSYATSMGLEGENTLRVPPQPKVSLEGKPFECPYCYTIRTVNGRPAWKY
jgi:hypothetical protein